MEATRPSSWAESTPSRNIRYSLYGYDYDDLMRLESKELREECHTRGIHVGPLTQKRTCAKELLAWKKLFAASEKPLSFDLVTEHDSLTDRLMSMDIESLRGVCRERGLAGSDDRLYHKSECISRIISFQQKNVAEKKLAFLMQQDQFLKLEELLRERNDLAFSRRDSLRSQQSATSYLHQTTNVPHASSSSTAQFPPGAVVQLRFSGSWYKATVLDKPLLRSTSEGNFLRVQYDHDGNIQDIDVSGANSKNICLVETVHAPEVPCISSIRFDPAAAEKKVKERLERKLDEAILENRLRSEEKEARRLAASTLIVKNMCRFFRRRKFNRTVAVVIIIRALRLNLYRRKELSRRHLLLLRRTFNKNNNAVTIRSLTEEAAFLAELAGAYRAKLDSVLSNKSLHPDTIIHRPPSEMESSDSKINLSNISKAESSELLAALSSLMQAAGEICEVPNKMHYSAVSNLRLNSDVDLSDHTDIKEERKKHFNSQAAQPLLAFLHGIQGSSSSFSASDNPKYYFIANLVHSAASRTVPFGMAWLAKELQPYVPRSTLTSICNETGVIPTPWYICTEESEFSIALLPISSSLGTVDTGLNAIAMQVDSDNFERSFAGQILNTTTVTERIVEVIPDQLPKLHVALQSLTAKCEIPMEATNLEFDASAWVGDEDGDALLMFSMASLAAEACNVRPIRTARPAELGDHRRSVLRWDYGLYPSRHDVTDDGFVMKQLHTKKSLSDGKNVWGRNKCRLLAQRFLPFADGTTLDALYNEALESAARREIQPIVAGDGAPMAYYLHRFKEAVDVLRKTPKSGANLKMPAFPKDIAEMKQFLSLSQSARDGISAAKQHITTTDPATGKETEEANPEWLNARRTRFTASAAAALVPIAIRDLLPGNAAAYIASHVSSIADKGFNVYETARSGVRGKIDDDFCGNKYTAYGNLHEADALKETVTALSNVYGPFDLLTSGLSIHATEGWLGASNDAEMHQGTIELKVLAAAGLKYESNAIRNPPPELPWGNPQKQPKGPGTWEVYDPQRRSFVSCPLNWAYECLGPAKFSHYCQMMIQCYVARSLGKQYRFVFYGVWHPARFWLYRAPYNESWTTHALIPWLRTIFWNEFYPCVLDLQQRVTEKVSDSGIDLHSAAHSAIRDSNAENNEHTNDDIVDLSDDAEVDVKGGAELTIPETDLAPDLLLRGYSRPALLSIGGLHEVQSDVKAATMIFSDELLCILKKSGCNPWVAETTARVDFLLGVGSLNRTRDFLIRQVLPGFLIFVTRQFSKFGPLPGNEYELLKWIIRIGSICPAFERLRLLARCATATWLHCALSKVPGRFKERFLLSKATAELKAAAGQDKKVELHMFDVVQKLTASDTSIAALLLGSKVHCGSHFKDSDHFIESIHERVSHIIPQIRLGREAWKAQLLQVTSTASDRNGSLANMGTEGPSNDTGSFGDISLNLGGHEEVASFFDRCFPNLPTPESFQENVPPHFAWFDASGSEHSNSDRCDISGTELKPGDIDPNRTGRAVYCDQLRKTIFGQVEPIKTDGQHGVSDVDRDTFNFRAAFGKTTRLNRFIASKAVREQTELHNEAILQAKESKDILVAYEKGRRVAAMRAYLKALQTGEHRPESTRSSPLFDADPDSSTRKEVADAIGLFKKSAPEYCSEIDVIASPMACGSSADAETKRAIARHIKTNERDIAAVSLLEKKCVRVANKRECDVYGLSDADGGRSLHELFGSSDIRITRKCDGGFQGCVLGSSFEGHVDAMRKLTDELRLRKSTCRAKSDDIANCQTETDDGIVQFLKYRLDLRDNAPEKGESFWAIAVPPVGSGAQCAVRANEFINGESNSAPDEEKKRANGRKDLRLRRKAGRNNGSEDPTAWSKVALQKFLRGHNKQSTGSRTQLEEWAKDIKNAPVARARSKAKAKVTAVEEVRGNSNAPSEGAAHLRGTAISALTVERLRAELFARSLSDFGGRAELEKSLIGALGEEQSEGMHLRSSVEPPVTSRKRRRKKRLPYSPTAAGTSKT